MKENTIWDVASLFNVTRGFVQNLLTSASSFASCMVHFTQVRLTSISRINIIGDELPLNFGAKFQR